MAVPSVSQIYNPVTGVFGTGQMQFFSSSGSWTVPSGINKVRVRLWGGGSGSNGSGGGFALRIIWDLTGVVAVAVTVGGAGGTSSFGSYVSATGGASSGGAVGAGSGGDINYAGGQGNTTGNSGGGAASLFGNGGDVPTAVSQAGGNGASGSGVSTILFQAGNGFLGQGGQVSNAATAVYSMPTSGMESAFSIDFIGTGGGGAGGQSGVNGGGGGGGNSAGGFPGGGGGSWGSSGLVIVEW